MTVWAAAAKADAHRLTQDRPAAQFFRRERMDSILNEAQKITEGSRHEAYGPAKEDYTRAAAIASAILEKQLQTTDIVKILLAVKLSREAHKHKRDNLTDLAGYARVLSIIEGDEESLKSEQRKKLLYLASPYSHPDTSVVNMRYEKVCAEAAQMMKEGAIVFSPIAHTHPIAMFGGISDRTWEFWKEQDFALLKQCDELVVLRLAGYSGSKGVQAEINFAQKLGKPISYRDPSC